MLNNWTGLGRMTDDVTLRYTNNQIPVCSFSIAVQDDYNSEQTDFIDVTAWRNSAEFASKHLKRGMRVIVKGRLKTRKRKFDGMEKEVTVVEVVAENLYPIWEKRPDNQKADNDQTFQEVDVDEGDLPF